MKQPEERRKKCGILVLTPLPGLKPNITWCT
jgi:hypothetical protein